MQRLVILALISLSLGIAIYFAGSLNRPSGWIRESPPDSFTRPGRTGCRFGGTSARAWFYGLDDGPQHRFAVGDNCCFISDNAPEAKAVLEKCPIGTGCRFKAEIVDVAPTIRFALRDGGCWAG